MQTPGSMDDDALLLVISEAEGTSWSAATIRSAFNMDGKSVIANSEWVGIAYRLAEKALVARERMDQKGECVQTPEMPANVRDMTLLIRRMILRLEPGNTTAAMAKDYLRRKGLMGDILREHPADTPTREQRVEDALDAAIRLAAMGEVPAEVTLNRWRKLLEEK
jgi:hypothetical protein